MNTYSMAVAKKIILLVPSPIRGGLGSGQFGKVILFTAVLIVCLAVSVWADNKSKQVESEPSPIKVDSPIKKEQAGVTVYDIDWTSINGGGELASTSTNYKIRASTAQSVIGESQSTNYKMGIGFWFGTGLYCTARAGDANADNKLTLPDIITLVNHVFKGAIKPNPACRGDVNNSNSITLPDIITMVNHVFKGAPKPPKDLDGVCCL